MAQALRHVEVELDQSLLSQAKEIVDNKQKMPGTFVPAEQLKYANPKGWKITPFCAVLMRSHELRVYGEYSTQKLEKSYNEVCFEVMLKDDCNINEVVLTLTLPNGNVQTHKVCLSNYPRDELISLKAGEFFNNFKAGDITFELKGTECETVKTGLIIFGVSIKPSIKPGPVNAA